MWLASQSLPCEGEEDEGPFAERSSSCCCAELQTGPVCPCQRTSLAIGRARRCLRLPATLRACQGRLCGDVCSRCCAGLRLRLRRSELVSKKITLVRRDEDMRLL
ncbi:hypothetical protein Q8A67_020409 [Cirrhinus molitorella]|uniref:Uncharacterized protein n=1 Tax=Cirrhinus molitorella TaxID=172907 RepID=A0AA88PBT3_9TELE|nr:hypothetical protein Q8A67_020409 [Cirrhinus molitorella]